VKLLAYKPSHTRHPFSPFPAAYASPTPSRSSIRSAPPMRLASSLLRFRTRNVVHAFQVWYVCHTLWVFFQSGFFSASPLCGRPFRGERHPTEKDLLGREKLFQRQLFRSGQPRGTHRGLTKYAFPVVPERLYTEARWTDHCTRCRTSRCCCCLKRVLSCRPPSRETSDSHHFFSDPPFAYP